MIPAVSTITYTGLDDLNTFLIDALTIINDAKTAIDALVMPEVVGTPDPDEEPLQTFNGTLYAAMGLALREPLEIALNNIKGSVNAILTNYGASPL